MTSKERIQKSLNHQEPDRVPYDLCGTTVTSITRNAYRKAMQWKGLPETVKEKTVDPIQQIIIPGETNLLYLRSDTRRIGARRIPRFEETLKKKGNLLQVTDYYGCNWEMDISKDFYFNQVSYPLHDPETLSESLSLLSVSEDNEYKTNLLRDLEEQWADTTHFACIADRNTAGFTENSMRLRGTEKWYLDTMLDEPGVERLFDQILEHKIKYWDTLIDWAEKNNYAQMIDVVSECDDLGSQTTTILDPDFLRRLVIPRFRILFGHLKKRLPHTRCFLHSCGSIRTILPDLIDAGLDILNPVQYTATGMDLKELKRDFGKDLIFWGGGIDTQSFLNRSKPDAIRDEVKRVLDIMAPGGGFVFAPVHNVQDDVPPENFWAMWETLMEFGKY